MYCQLSGAMVGLAWFCTVGIVDPNWNPTNGYLGDFGLIPG